MSKPRYQRPSISRHVSGSMNKIGGGQPLRPVTEIDGVPVEELVSAYGSPVFVYSQRSIEEKYQELHSALTRHWPKVQLAWSYKTCYLDAVCRVYHQQGSWAEVVSGMELAKAVGNGVPLDQIIYNGPWKSRESLELALGGGTRVNIDHLDELALAEQVALELGHAPGVGLRLNMATGPIQRWDRFGFNLDSGQAWDAVRRLVGGGKLRLNGLHAHIGTFILDPKAYATAAAKVAAFANRLRRELGITLEYIDLGGGFASRSRLKGQYLPAEQVTPAFDQYAEAVGRGLSTLDYPSDELPTLYLETGRALVDEAGTLITTVLANKRLADGRRALVMDAGVNVLFTSYWYRHNLVPASDFYGVPEPTVVYGPLCMNIDVICDNLNLPPMPAGSRMLVRPVGAYNVTQSMQFIHLRPAVAMISPSGDHGVIRRAEKLSDLTGPERVPGWLDPVEPVRPVPAGLH